MPKVIYCDRCNKKQDDERDNWLSFYILGSNLRSFGFKLDTDFHFCSNCAKAVIVKINKIANRAKSIRSKIKKDHRMR